MQKRYQALLSKNHDFLVNEMPMDETLEAIRSKNILSWHDFDQLKTLRHQGRRALARYFLAVLPKRGSNAFQALLESLQEANAQHLVDLLLQQAGITNMEDLSKTPPPDKDESNRTDSSSTRDGTPSDTPLPLGPDPHEYAIRLVRNSKFIREIVDPADIGPVLTQNKVITPREADMVLHLHGKSKKWDLIFAALLQRGERAYQAFMAALLQKDYAAVFHTIQETSVELSGSSDDEDGGLTQEDAKPVPNQGNTRKTSVKDDKGAEEEIKSQTISGDTEQKGDAETQPDHDQSISANNALTETPNEHQGVNTVTQQQPRQNDIANPRDDAGPEDDSGSRYSFHEWTDNEATIFDESPSIEIDFHSTNDQQSNDIRNTNISNPPSPKEDTNFDYGNSGINALNKNQKARTHDANQEFKNRNGNNFYTNDNINGYEERPFQNDNEVGGNSANRSQPIDTYNGHQGPRQRNGIENGTLGSVREEP